MATGLTKTALTRHLAEKLELTNKQSAAFLDLLAETAIKETKKNGVFVIPGIGRLVKAERKARIGRNPQTGAAIKIKAKTVVKFRVAKAAKDVIAPAKKKLQRKNTPDCGLHRGRATRSTPSSFVRRNSQARILTKEFFHRRSTTRHPIVHGIRTFNDGKFEFQFESQLES